MKTKAIDPDARLTTGQVAEMTQVAMRTVAKWCDAGILRCCRLPASHHRQSGKRRILARHLAAFMKEHGMPLPRELVFDPPPVVYAADLDGAGPFFGAVLAARPDAVRFSGSAFEVARLSGKEPPDAIVVGTAGGLGGAAGLAAALLDANPVPAVAVVLGDDQGEEDPRLDRVRGRLCWVGRTPDSWQEVVTALGITGARGVV